jgi:uncharacterized membrane protein
MKNKAELNELVREGLIDAKTAEAIAAYYAAKQGSSNRLLMVFGILGAILVGLGIILIIAHNWDDFSVGVKSVIGFLPLIIGQAACAYALFVKPESVSIRESSATFTFFGIGATISIISQIYNIEGELSGFLLTWMVLALPLIYVMRSSMTSLLYIAGISYYAVESGYWNSSGTASYYWLLFIGAIPHYWYLILKKAESNFTAFHHWMLPLSVIIALGTIARSDENWMFVAYMSLFGLLYGIGQSGFIQSDRVRQNSYRVLGSLGTVVLLLVLSFSWFWDDLYGDDLFSAYQGFSAEAFTAFFLTVPAAIVWWSNWRKRRFSKLKPVEPVFIIFLLLYLLGHFSSYAVVLINLLLLAVAVMTIQLGAAEDNLGVLNYGLLIIAALAGSRFFDGDLSFVLKGILFLLVGISFFAANYYLLKKRKNHG